MKEYIIRNLTNFPLELSNFDKYFYSAKKQLMEYLNSRKKNYKDWQLLEIECIECIEPSDNNHIHYNFIFDADEYSVWLFKNDGDEVAKGNIFHGVYEPFNTEFKRIKIGRFYNIGLVGMFWLNLEKAKQYLVQEYQQELANQHPQKIIMFEAEKDTFKKDIIFSFLFQEGNGYSVFCTQEGGYPSPYKIMDRYFNSGEARLVFKEELEPQI